MGEMAASSDSQDSLQAAEQAAHTAADDQSNAEAVDDQSNAEAVDDQSNAEESPKEKAAAKPVDHSQKIAQDAKALMDYQENAIAEMKKQWQKSKAASKA